MISISLNVAPMCISISNNCCYYVGQQTKQSESIKKEKRKKSSLAWLELKVSSFQKKKLSSLEFFQKTNLSQHLDFLEEAFQQIMPEDTGMNPEADSIHSS